MRNRCIITLLVCLAMNGSVALGALLVTQQVSYDETVSYLKKMIEPGYWSNERTDGTDWTDWTEKGVLTIRQHETTLTGSWGVERHFRVSISSLDPESVKVIKRDGKLRFVVYTTDLKKVVSVRAQPLEARSDKVWTDLPGTASCGAEFTVPRDDTGTTPIETRIKKALQNLITLSGGKPSKKDPFDGG